MPRTQPVRIKTPLAAEDLLFRAMSGTEEMGRLFHYDLDLVSPKEDLSLDDVLGHPASVELDLPNGGVRYFHGYVTHFSLTGRRGGYATYTMQLRPWLWFLTRTADCRIFQNKTVPEILKEVFREHGFSDFTDSLSGTYRKWEYCVQYRETDFNFVSRLMEQEGIYYFFQHEAGKHTLVLADSYGAHGPADGYGDIPYFPPSEQVMRDEHVYDWYLGKSVQPGKYVLRAYDFRKPKANLEVNSAVTRSHAQAEYEMFDYPGEYFERGEGDAYVRARMEELEAQYERVRGAANARGICAGALFNLTEYPRADQNREYLVLSSRQSISLGDYESADGEGLQYECLFEAIDSKIPYRSAVVTPKPTVQGPQTAIVVGKSGEEIWTDEYGRVKVQFHWDRYGKADENSSCWVRVAQVWAGTQWGGMHIPRIGQEVIVDFIEGDPDRPIVTGRVYNADNMPPYGLPDNKTQSGLKSRSSKGGTRDNFNEIRFEDKKGEEEMYLHAEKNQTIVVENDKTESVGNDNTESIGHDEKIDVGNNRDKTVGVNQTEKIGSNKTITVGADHTETIGANKKLQVGANHTESIGGNMTQNVGGNKAETIAVGKALTIGGGYQVAVGGAMNQTIGGSKSEQVAGSKSERVGGSRSATIGDDSSESVGKSKSVSAGKEMSLTSGDNFSISGGKKGTITIADELTIKCGKATITMKKNGDILINGKKIQVKASGDVVMKGKKILEN